MTIGTTAAFDGQMPANTERAFQANVTGDANRRVVLFADGKIEWGDGTASRDTNLYRSAAGKKIAQGKHHSATAPSTTPNPPPQVDETHRAPESVIDQGQPVPAHRLQQTGSASAAASSTQGGTAPDTAHQGTVTEPVTRLSMSSRETGGLVGSSVFSRRSPRPGGRSRGTPSDDVPPAPSGDQGGVRVSSCVARSGWVWVR